MGYYWGEESKRQWFSCRRKKKYNKNTAYKHARAKMNKKPGLQLHIYECDYCGYWHLTKQGRETNIKVIT